MKKWKIVILITVIFQIIISCSNNDSMNIEIKRNGKSIIFTPKKVSYSGHYLKLIPMNPNYTPSESLQKDLIILLAKKYPENEIESHLSKRIEFIDPGVNFEKVFCNICEKEIDMDIWSDFMSEWYKKENASMKFTTPCCNTISNLNDLNYDSPSGYSKFVLVINNAEYYPVVVESVKKSIEGKTGEKFREIWARY